MNVLTTDLPGVLVFEPKVFGDARGFFMETWNARRYAEAGLPMRFVQDNLSRSSRGVLRGLHVQHPSPQGKLVSVLEGEVFDVAVDIRTCSPTFRRWTGTALSSDNRRQMYIPEGFAHGFVVLSDTALVSYKCTDFYDPSAEMTIRWDDPDIAIAWPVDEPTLSTKDAAGGWLRDLSEDRLPCFREPIRKAAVSAAGY